MSVSNTIEDGKAGRYLEVRAAFLRQGSSLHAWCAGADIRMQNARAAMLGTWQGPKAPELSRAALDRLARAEHALEDLVQDALNSPPETALRCDVPVTDHRRAHRFGRPAKLDTDPELRAFVRARLDRLTFTEIADEAAQTVPEARRIGKSAIHAWWTRHKPR